MRQAATSRHRERECRQARYKVSGGSTSAPQDEEQQRPQRATPAHYRREYLRWLWPYRFSILALFGLSLFAAFLDALWPLAIKKAIDLIGTDFPYARKMHLLNVYGAMIVILLLGKHSLEVLRNWRSGILNAKVTFRLRGRLFDRLLHVSLGELSQMKSGGIVSRLSNDVESVSGLIDTAVMGPAVAVLRIVITLCVLCVLSWRLAVAAVLILPPLGFLSFIWVRRVRPVYRSIFGDRSETDARVNETFGGIRVVRAFRRESREERAHAVGNHTIIRKALHAQRMEMTIGAAWGLLIPSALLTTIWYGGRLCVQGFIKVGDIVAFNVYLLQILAPVTGIISSIGQTQKALAAMERVFDTLEMDIDKPDARDAVDAPRIVHDIRLRSVCFEHRPGVPVIRDVSLDIPGGSMVALVGPSGAGKSTLTDLIARFHDPLSGEILLNGIDLRLLRLRSYRSLLAVVPQEVFLFDGTVRDNIAYGRRDASDEEVLGAARRANADEFIQQLPEGYDTMIGERGFKLSGGQRQRLSIARAILADPQILILDEATSNLDTQSEQLIQAALGELLTGRTTFVIAHRLSTITHADLIVVMERGAVVEYGKHDELMFKGGPYSEMVERQRQSFDWQDGRIAVMRGRSA